MTLFSQIPEPLPQAPYCFLSPLALVLISPLQSNPFQVPPAFSTDPLCSLSPKSLARHTARILDLLTGLPRIHRWSI